MSIQKLKNEVADMCEQAGCSEMLRKIHFDQYVNHRWHPHPPQNFVDWWSRHNDCSDITTSKIAYNTRRYREEYLEHKGVGLA